MGIKVAVLQHSTPRSVDLGSRPPLPTHIHNLIEMSAWLPRPGPASSSPPLLPFALHSSSPFFMQWFISACYPLALQQIYISMRHWYMMCSSPQTGKIPVTITGKHSRHESQRIRRKLFFWKKVSSPRTGWWWERKEDTEKRSSVRERKREEQKR